MGLDFRYVQPDGSIEPAILSIMYARAYLDWFPFDFHRVAPSLAGVWSYDDTAVEPRQIARLRSDVKRVLAQRALCPWGGSMETRIREEFVELDRLLETAAATDKTVRIIAQTRPREIAFYVRLPNGRLDEPFAAAVSGSSQLEVLAKRLGSRSVIARVWVYEATPLSAEDTERLAEETSEASSDPLVSRIAETCRSALARGLGVHVAGGSYGEGLQVILSKDGGLVASPHPGLNLSMSITIPDELALAGKVWDYTKQHGQN